jgi:hypothetical protein
MSRAREFNFDIQKEFRRAVYSTFWFIKLIAELKEEDIPRFRICF